MKTLQFKVILLSFLLIQCSLKKEKEFFGIWQNKDSTRLVNYYEAHITNSEFVVVNESGFSYLSSYNIKSDTIIQYLKDHNSNLEIVDTVKFTFEKNGNTLILRNEANKELYSEWKRINGLKPFKFEKNANLKSFAQEFKERYLVNYLKKSVNKQEIENYLKNFEISWNIKEK